MTTPTTTSAAPTYITRGALAASRKSRAAELTHSVQVVPDGLSSEGEQFYTDIAVLCGRIRLDNITDSFAPVDHHERPTCTICARRDPRFI